MEGLLNAAVVMANFVLVPATAYGAQLALGALGVTLIFGILRFSNFAHGDTMAFGAAMTWRRRSFCWPPTAASTASTAARRPTRSSW